MFDRKAVAVPSSRLSRLAKLGGLASSIAGNVAAEVARRLARGERPRLEDLLLTPDNAMRAADQLARMRGAAMKVGQLISMDAGDMLPPELAQIFDRLRSEAHHMPWPQLRRVLTHAWGAATGGTGSRRSTPIPSPRPQSARSTGREPGAAATWRSRCNTPAFAAASIPTWTTSPR
jgi:predicted unusual protein kinase regulating ubiquinone biosynthesis (AarF/ABC1/UbiB family)